MAAIGSYISLEDQIRISNGQLDQLELENERVVDQLKEVIQMNTHWQRYDSQREDFVLKLTKANQELQDMVSDLRRQITELNKHLQRKMKNEHSTLSEGFGHLELSDDEVKVVEEIKNMSRDLKSVRLPSSSSLRKEDQITASRLQEADEQLWLLREQVNICVEDFNQERKDRERCHEENERLRDRLAQAENQLRANDEQIYVYQEQIKRLGESLQFRQTTTPNVSPRRNYDEPCCHHEQRPLSCHTRDNRFIFGDGTTRRPRQTATYTYADNVTELPGDVEVDGVSEESQDQADGATNDTTATDKRHDIVDGQDDTVLLCPQCLKSFGVERHCELLDHIHTCLEHEH